MIADEFRRLALSLRGTVEGRHHDHPDFRVHGKIFATLGYPDGGWAMVRLTPAQQARFVGASPECFQSVKGAWGRRGATSVNLFAATPALVRRSLVLAHRNVCAARRRPAPRPPSEQPRADAAGKKRAS
jgi:hypothetical protein